MEDEREEDGEVVLGCGGERQGEGRRRVEEEEDRERRR